ncbi:MAG: Prolipoprotein diacylglyceryl transferase [Syntrophus sp. PtaU1.Bin005]|jgi:hypothetical protein|nr:MAG: Prolipoprotein diacylglyceryl transferase [Syntrophus sp. PtaU1.Bin005]
MMDSTNFFLDSNAAFLLLLGFLQFLLFSWAFRNLPKENWQFLAVIPNIEPGVDAHNGTNYTWYGLFLATGYVLGALMFLLLMGSIAVPWNISLVVTVIVLAVCTPLSSIIARLVEGKKFTLTVGGAVFGGLLISPWIVHLLNMQAGTFLGYNVPVLPTMAAMAIAYGVGEGTGRLACISFGCCYGKSVNDLPSGLRKLLSPIGMTFSGKTKKIAYAHSLDGHAVVPIQAMTAIVYSATSLYGSWLFLNSSFEAAFTIVIGISQGWRILSEFLRADYRGNNKFTSYQRMSLLSLPYAAGLLFFFPQSAMSAPSIEAGLKSIWSPGMILFLQGLWAIIFLYTGKSKVTAARISFHVVKDRI